MYLSENEIKELAQNKENVLRAFLEKKIPEGYYLDYKIELSRKADKDEKREFLKDVSGFANANGGNIIIGAQEPSETLTLDDQLIGIVDGDKIAHDLERLASSSIDPRIPGLCILPVAFSTGRSKGRYAIVVHTPPSLVRPHMVNYKDEDGKEHKTFYIRHTESTVAMSTYEIREAVFASASAEARAKEYLERWEKDAKEYDTGGAPAFLLQAMPLIPYEQPWDVLSNKIREVLHGQQRRNKYDLKFALACNLLPIATIVGIKGYESSQDPKWLTEVHRNGYISASYKVQKRKVPNDEGYFLHKKDCQLFSAFCDLCNELIKVANADSPYILRCKYLGARGTRLQYIDSGFSMGTWTEPYYKNEISWPDQIRQVGKNFDEIAVHWSTQLFNAFGLDSIQ